MSSLAKTTDLYAREFDRDPLKCIRQHIANKLKRRERSNSTLAEYPYSTLWFLVWAEQRITQLEAELCTLRTQDSQRSET